MDAYISKITSQGQVTLPNQVRKKLKIDMGDYIEFDSVGNAIVVRKLFLKEKELEKIRAKIRKSGISKDRVKKLVEESSEEAWNKHYAKAISRC